MNTIRQNILADLRAALSQIRMAEGYASDVGAAIVRASGKRTLEQLPALWVTPGTEQAERTSYGEDTITLPVTLRAGLRYTLDDDPENQEAAIETAAEAVLGDLRTAIGVFYGICEEIDDVAYKSGGVEDWPDWAQGEAALTVTVEIEIIYRTNKNNPHP